MGMDNKVFLEVIEWLDKTGEEIVHRIPENGSGEIKLGARLIVRDSQAAVFFYNGKATDAFGAGNHMLHTGNLPILNKILSIPWGTTSPLRAEVYFINLKVFTNLKWGTHDPVAFKDRRLGVVRIRAFGVFNLQVVQPVLFINSLVGTRHMFLSRDIEDYLSQVIVSRFNDHLGENLDSILDLPGRYEELSKGLVKRLMDDFSRFGLGLNQLFINSITPPPEVQQALDDKSRLNVFDDLNKLLKMKAAMAVEKMADQGGAASGAGLGMGMMLPSMFAQVLSTERKAEGTRDVCPDCGNPVPPDARFCPYCGNQMVILQSCPHCGKNLAANAKFCPRCGKETKPPKASKKCPHCGAKNLTNSIFCNACGERL
jgi:membrane protease subunit (stomatin/prohibitin family)